MEWLTNPEIWIAFFTLTALEIVLGIDNIIMISILVSRMPKHMQPRTRIFGLALAMVTRILLLLSITWVMRLTDDLFVVFGQGISGRDLILFFGGLFLLWKSSQEMYHALEGEDETHDEPKGAGGKFIYTIIQIAIIDIVFSLDSVITAVGMVSHVPAMVAAIVVAVLVMMLAAGTISDFIDKHPSLKMLALSFLIMLAFVLAELLILKWVRKTPVPWKDVIFNLNSGHILMWVFRGVEVAAFALLLRHANLHIVDQWPVAAQWVLAFFAWDLCFYWMHRLHHKIPLLWAVHVVHHQGEHFNLSLGVRNSWYSSLTNFPFIAILAVLGVPLEIFLVVSSLHYTVQFYNHNALVNKSGILDKFMVTPSHQIGRAHV